jgi:hypothetical protein
MTWNDRMAQLRAMSWRDVIPSDVLSCLASICTVGVIAPVVVALLGPASRVFVIPWVFVMLSVIFLGFGHAARWWLVWLLGTLVWESGMLALCVWQLLVLVES